MSRERILEVVLTMLGAVLLLIAAAGKHPYGFYMVLRLAITVGAVYWAWRVYKEGQQVWAWIFVAVALLLNPFLRIHMQRTQWQPIDLCLGIFLIGWSGYWFFHKIIRSTETYRKGNLANFRAILVVVRKIVVVLVVLIIGLMVPGYTGEAFRAHSSLFLLFLAMMVLATGVLAHFVGKLSCSSNVKVIWLALICYLSLISVVHWDFMRNKFGYRFVPGYYSYYDCEDATPDDPCYFSAYRVNSSLGWGRLSATIEGFSLLYVVSCIACPWAAYRLWKNTQTNIETHYNDEQNAIKAARLLTEAEQGNAEAQKSLGFFYCIGAGVPLDYEQAAKWFRKAAEQGNAQAQFYLGLSYYNGEGLPKDYAQAAFWWRKAAEQGEDTAQYNLKYLLHYKGEDVP